MPSKTIDITKVLGTKYGDLEKPITYTDDEITKIIHSRELNDRSKMYERQLALDEMFPNRTSGRLYTSEPEMSEEDLFDLWAD